MALKESEYSSIAGYLHAVGINNKSLITNSTKTKLYLATPKATDITSAYSGIYMLIWTPATDTYQEIEASFTPLGSMYYLANNTVAMCRDGDDIHAVALTRTATSLPYNMHIFYGIFDVATEAWTHTEHLSHPVWPSVASGDVLPSGTGAEIYQMSDGVICFSLAGEEHANMGVPYSRTAIAYRIGGGGGGSWGYITDATSDYSSPANSTNLNCYYDSVKDAVVCAAQQYATYSWWRFENNPIPAWVQDTDGYYYSGHALKIPVMGFPLSTRTPKGRYTWYSTTNKNVSTSAQTGYSASQEINDNFGGGFDDLDCIHIYDSTLQRTEWLVGGDFTLTSDGIVNYHSVMEIDANREASNFYIQEAGQPNTAWGGGAYFNDGSTNLELWELGETNTGNNIQFSWTRHYEPPINYVTSSLVRGNSQLIASVSITGAGALTANANLVRGDSQLTSNVIFFLESFVRGYLVRGSSHMSAYVELGYFRKYLTALFSDITKTSQKLESLRFTMTIDDVEFKMQGFSIRSSSVDSETKISNIAEIRAYLSDTEASTYIPQIGSVYVIIKSIYSFGSTESESVLFEGLLDDIQKKGLDTYSFIKASNTQNASGSSFHTPEKIVTYSATSARIKFDHTIKPNDYIQIDGALRKALRLTHYNYEGYNSYTEVHSG